MIYMGKGVDTALRIIIDIPEHTVYHTRRSGCGCNFSGIEYIERQSIVGLITCTISHRDPFCQPKVSSRLGCDTPLYGECRHNLRKDIGIKPEVIKEESCRTALLKVPKHHFTQTGNGGAQVTGETHGGIIARQHYFVDTFECLRLVLLNPGKLGGSEITRRIEKMAQTLSLAKVTECFLAVRHTA